MFGMNDNQQQSNDDPAMLDNVKQLVSEPSEQVVPQQQPAAPPTAGYAPAPATDDNSSATTDTSSAQSLPVDEHKAEPAEGFSSTPMPATPDPAPQIQDNSASTDSPEPASQPDYTLPTQDDASSDDSPQIGNTSSPADSSTPVPASDDSTPAPAPQQPINKEHLSGLKQQALEHLEPLTDHIDGTPEETFKTTMMMIQANDNHSLLEKALEAAKKIEDDKVRAQAMLDIVNEINYFSQIDSEQ
jgi:hypothetical protein